MKFFSGRGFSRTAAIAAAMTCASTTLALTPSNLKLEAADTTIGVGQKLVVAIKMDGSVSAAGAQLVIAFDSSKLSLDVAGGNAYTLPVGSPMDFEIYESVSTGMLKLALGTTEGDGDATVSGDIAYLTFTCLDTLCDASGLVSFASSGGFSTKLSDATGAAVSLGTAVNLGGVTRMITMPAMMARVMPSSSLAVDGPTSVTRSKPACRSSAAALAAASDVPYMRQIASLIFPLLGILASGQRIGGRDKGGQSSSHCAATAATLQPE